MKTYSDFMDEITADELYDKLIQYGLFSEKLPPIFDCSKFKDYCRNNINNLNFCKQPQAYVYYDSMRNINLPRPIGIPTPLSHVNLCKCLKDNWSTIQEHFRNTTKNQDYIISRIHIRKMLESESLFMMNYKNWIDDGTPEPDIQLGKRYVIFADISKCYPSIYTHALSWALVGKETAKCNKSDKNAFYNQIDFYARNTKNNETHGILIGPHTSNILSEIILCKVDETLCQKWQYIRNIDDFCCFVSSRDEAEKFLIDLNSILREYDLSLNHKKTEIQELPVGLVDKWIHQLNSQKVYIENSNPYGINYLQIQAFLDFCIKLMSNNKDNASIILYALKLLKGKKLTKNAIESLAKRTVSLALIYPYIVPLLDDYIFSEYKLSKNEIDKYSNLIFNTYIDRNIFEPCSYSLFYAIKNEISINKFDVNKIINSKDCILLTLSLIYCKKNNDSASLLLLENHAQYLINSNQFEEYWIFVYECLDESFFSDDWKCLKKNKISFLKNEFI